MSGRPILLVADQQALRHARLAGLAAKMAPAGPSLRSQLSVAFCSPCSRARSLQAGGALLQQVLCAGQSTHPHGVALVARARDVDEHVRGHLCIGVHDAAAVPPHQRCAEQSNLLHLHRAFAEQLCMGPALHPLLRCGCWLKPAVCKTKTCADHTLSAAALELCIWHRTSVLHKELTVQGSPEAVPMEIMSPTSKGCTTKRNTTLSNSVLNMFPNTKVKDTRRLPTVTQMCWKLTCTSHVSAADSCKAPRDLFKFHARLEGLMTVPAQASVHHKCGMRMLRVGPACSACLQCGQAGETYALGGKGRHRMSVKGRQASSKGCQNGRMASMPGALTLKMVR